MFKSMDLVEGKDFYWEEKNGIKYRIFTERYLRETRDVCCGNGCKHCPFKKD